MTKISKKYVCGRKILLNGVKEMKNIRQGLIDDGYQQVYPVYPVVETNLILIYTFFISKSIIGKTLY